MIRSHARTLHGATTAIALSTMIGALVAMPSPAQARVFVGVGIGVPYFGPAYLPPPPVYYYPPPVYYAPPPVYYSQPQTYTPMPQASPAGGQACYAGPYVCPMERPTSTGATCYCSGSSGQRVWGRAS
jgi:hypothetical protein